MKKIAVTTVLVGLVLIGCSNVSNISDIAKESVVVGTVGGVNALATYLKFTPVNESLSKVLRRPVRVFSEWDIHAVKIHLKSNPGYYHLLYLNPVEYCELLGTVRLWPIAIRVNQNNSSTESALIVVPKTSPIRKVSDLRNKRVTLGPYGDPYMFYSVLELFRNEHLPIALIKDFSYCNSSLDVVRRLNLGLADAGVVTETWWKTTTDKTLDLQRLLKNDLRIIAKTVPTPEYIWVATEAVSKKDRKKIADLLINGLKSKSNALNSFQAVGFAPVDEKILAEYCDRLKKIKNIPPKPLFH